MVNKTFVKKIEEKLLNEKKELLSKTQNKIDSDIESVDLDGDEIDEIQGIMLIDMQTKIATRQVDKIFKINEALLRINNSTYGICEDCNEDIPEKRLTANPYFVLCVSCAEEREIESKQKGN